MESVYFPMSFNNSAINMLADKYGEDTIRFICDDLYFIHSLSILPTELNECKGAAMAFKRFSLYTCLSELDQPEYDKMHEFIQSDDYDYPLYFEKSIQERKDEFVETLKFTEEKIEERTVDISEYSIPKTAEKTLETILSVLEVYNVDSYSVNPHNGTVSYTIGAKRGKQSKEEIKSYIEPHAETIQYNGTSNGWSKYTVEFTT